MKTHGRKLVFLLASVLALFWAIANPPGVHSLEQKTSPPSLALMSSEKLYGLPGLKNVGRLEPGLYRGAQPEDEGYETLRKMGIKTVLNLRNRHDETEKVRSAGMVPLRVRMNIFRDPDPAQIREVIGILSDPALRPLYFHCAYGKDRTGTVAAVYRMERHGWPMGLALEEMQDFGFNGIWKDYKKFVERYKVSKETETHSVQVEKTPKEGVTP